MGKINSNNVPLRFRNKNIIFEGDQYLITKAIEQMGKRYNFVKEFRLTKDGDYYQSDVKNWYRGEAIYRNTYSFHDISEWFLPEKVEEYI